MKRKGRVLLMSIVVAALLSFAAGCPAPEEVTPEEPIVWKFACFGSSTSAVAKQYIWLFNEIEKRSEGRLKIEPYWSQSLCPAKEQPMALKSGLCQVTNIQPNYYPAKFPIYNMGALPMILPLRADDETCWRTIIDIFDEWASLPVISKEFDEYNALYFAHVDPATYTLMGNIRPTNLEELKGEKIRALGTVGELLSRAGAVPVSAIVPEMYDVLSKGTVDAVMHTWLLFHPLRLYEVSKYYAPEFALGLMPYSLAISKRDYEALPEDIKEIIREIQPEYYDTGIEMRVAAKKEAMEAFRGAGVEFFKFSEEDYEKLREIAKSIWEEEVQRLEAEGLPAKEAFNDFQNISKQHIPEYEPYYIK